jgi:phosphate transport system substrate-binding protein
MAKKLSLGIKLMVVAGLMLSACSPAAAPAEAPAVVPATEVSLVSMETVVAPASPDINDPATLSGMVITAGSSTVFPLSEVMAERFKEEGFGGEVTIDSIGTGAGFERFCVTGETDISNASRKIKDSELEKCKAINRNPIQFRVGTDALAVVVSSENDFLTDVTVAELGKIFSSSTVKWSDVRPEWPNEDILRFSPGTDSGTFDYFVEAVLGPNFKSADGKADLEAAKADILGSSNIQFSEDDNVLVQGVEGSKYAIGYFGFAYYMENQAALKAVSLEGVSPDMVTAEDGTYKLARPLFIYSDASIIKSKPEVAGFISFYLTYVNDEIQSVGYFPASQAALDEAKAALAEALK